MNPREKAALAEGLSDAVGFVLGALLGWGAGRLLGLDFFAPGAGYDAAAMAHLVLIALGCGVGKWAAMRWRAARSRRAGSDAR